MNLNIFNTHSLFEAATNLFKELGITLNSNTALALPIKDLLKKHYKNNDTFNAIEKTYFIGQIDDSIFKNTGIFDVQYSYNEVLEQDDKYNEGLILFALELNKQPSKSEISTLTRAFNRISKNLPVALLLKYDINNSAVISIAISERFMYKQNWQQGEKTGKVIILKDIHTINTHAGHLRILLDLVKPNSVNNYSELHKRWLEVLDVSVLNKKFFKELANWYFGAMDNVSFPDDIEKQKELRNATNLIRLITRIIFIWFIKEKSLVPNLLFNKSYLDKVLKDFNKNNKSKNYYNAILQNLFFGTLNQEVNERKFAQDGDIHTNKKEFFVKNIYRYANLFNISNNEVINLFKDVPFLNGGLFDCLDKEDEHGIWNYVDGFSRNPLKQACVPDYIFFGEETEIDLNDIYATKNKKYKTKGLINILESYKFTVTENTPIEEEIALDPELLGKVFENLLASYNPETKTTARKQTGSFYTPREIVNYMVDESLLEYIKQNVKNESENFETQLRNLFSYSNDYKPFNEKETYAIIEAINKCKILDPACGSGAYPMGILHKMVYLLQKLDPENQYWKALQRKKAIDDTEAAFNIGNKAERDFRLKQISDVFENNASDYGRKLYLIENCIYGIDIQPIAVQISKLRFFISLIIDQEINFNEKNYGLQPLPNLEFKLVCANTLIAAPDEYGDGGFDFKDNYTELFIKYTAQYFKASNINEKEIVKKNINNLIDKIVAEKQKQVERGKEVLNTNQQNIAQNKLDLWNSYKNLFKHKTVQFFEIKYFFPEVKNGFDIVIGNPPYVQVKQIEPYFKKNYQDIYKFAIGRFNLFYFFIELSEKLTKSNAITSYIIPDRLLLNTQCVELRSWLLNKQKIVEIVSFDELVFENAVVDSIILSYKNTINSATELIAKNNINLKNINTKEGIIIPISYFKNSPNNQFDLNYSVLKSDTLKKIVKNTIKLSEISETRDGIIQSKIPDVLFLKERKNEHCEKLLFGKDILKYGLNFNNNWVNYQPEKMMKIEVERGGAGLRLRDRKIFESIKILTRQTADTIIATIDTDKYFYSNTLHGTIIKDENYDIKFVLALLNSNVLKYYYRQTTSEGGKVFAQVKIEILRQMPIKITTKESQIPFIIIIDYLLFLHKKETPQNLSNIENIQIASHIEDILNIMVYEIYLPEEVKAGGADVLKYLIKLPELQEGQEDKNLKTIEKVYKELSDQKHPVCIALLKIKEIQEIKIIEGAK